MKSLSINDYLNKDNPWSQRLLGIVPFTKNRDILQVENEYNLDKYAKLLNHDLKTMEDYKVKEFELGGKNASSDMQISIGDDIFSTSVANARKIYYDLIKEKLKPYASEHTCELGCGYGYNLSFAGENAYGGEYSKNAVTLGRKLGMDVREFNYYDENDYLFIKEDSTIFTAHSIEQIPDARIIVNSLEKQRHKINYVIHFEPTYVEERYNLIGLMRNRYIEINDYNRNLIQVLKGNSSIEILELKHDVFGLVPLNSTNLIVWKFRNE